MGDGDVELEHDIKVKLKFFLWDSPPRSVLSMGRWRTGKGGPTANLLARIKRSYTSEVYEGVTRRSA